MNSIKLLGRDRDACDPPIRQAGTGVVAMMDAAPLVAWLLAARSHCWERCMGLVVWSQPREAEDLGRLSVTVLQSAG